jgi:hypothetical protein
MHPMKKTFLTLAACAFSLISPVLADPTIGFVRGFTTVKLASATTDALTALGVTPSALPGSYLHHGRAYFPIFGGALDLETAVGEILHSGGLKFAKGEVKVTLSGFSIDTTDGAVLTGLAAVNGDVVGRIPLFDVVLPAGITLPLPAPEGRRFELEGAMLKLRPEAAAALNASFSVTAFAAGLEIGTAKIRSHVRKL